MAAAEWLAARSRSYHADARNLEHNEDDLGLIDGMTSAEWAIVYRAVAEELRKCAKETQK